MHWTNNTRNALQIALAWCYAQKSEMGLIGWMRYLCPIDKTRIDNDGLIVDGLEVGLILKAVSEQRPPVRAWLEYCYGPDRLDFMRTQIAFDIAHENFGTLGAKRFKRHLKFCELVVDDYSIRMTGDQSNPEKPSAYTTEMYISLMNMKCDAQQWEADWGRKKECVLRPLTALDSEGVGNVSITVRRMREREVESNGRKTYQPPQPRA